MPTIGRWRVLNRYHSSYGPAPEYAGPEFECELSLDLRRALRIYECDLWEQEQRLEEIWCVARELARAAGHKRRFVPARCWLQAVEELNGE